ncbi:hypothetical protein ACFOEW_20690 [Alteromonas oceani]|uniref:Uncharacterized protein n=1 Tax=Alteromonas oceani TaxID=2071609 RepID=A0ABV7K1G8_9ALTE|nr:hypothetical protein [Alteromonas oceani]
MKGKFLAVVFLLFGWQNTAIASATTTQPSLSELEQTVNRLYSKIRGLESAQANTDTEVSKLQEAIKSNGVAVVLFAFFCAWWAKTTGRSVLGRFLLGLIFHVLTAIALLIKNEHRE